MNLSKEDVIDAVKKGDLCDVLGGHDFVEHGNQERDEKRNMYIKRVVFRECKRCARVERAVTTWEFVGIRNIDDLGGL